MAQDPVHQFEVYKLASLKVGGVDLSFTNVSAYMFLTVILTSGLIYLFSRSGRLIPTRWQSLAEIPYEFVENLLRESVGSRGRVFLPLIFSLFMFILIANLLGMFPYFYTITSQIIVTFALAMLVILTVVIYGITKHGWRFLRLFVPRGVPIAILPLISCIEVVSFLSRPISLSVRLFANMLAGHITLKVFAGFIVSLSALGFWGIGGAILPLIMTVAITALEVLVAFLQAYVFTVLACMYLNDAVHPEH
ncbi:F0F1 ATP synthase subunit A [Bartonella sp. DGB1]|uniref:F0F1 ATP synthase subunit A n=1 Tax=Bartonella sp. DGB1 TaxID=3239807 RepID=UPI00352335A2